MSDFDLWNKDSDHSPNPDPNRPGELKSKDQTGTNASIDAKAQDTNTSDLKEASASAAYEESAVHMDSNPDDIKVVNLSSPETNFMGENTNSSSPTPNPVLEPRKKMPKWIFVIAGVVAAAVIAMIVVFTVPSISNKIALATLSPSKYYQKVEKNSLSKSADDISKFYGEIMNPSSGSEKDTDSADGKRKAAVQMDMKFQVDPSFAEEMEEPELVKLNGLNAVMSTFFTEEKMKNDIAFSYDSKPLATLTYIYDMLTSKIFINIKELSDAYLSANMKDANLPGSYSFLSPDQQKIALNINGLSEFPLKEKDLNKLLKRYGTVIVEALTNVSLDKNKTVTIEDVSGKCTEITVKITMEDLKNIISAVLDEAKQDNELKQIVQEIGKVSESEYDAFISLAKVAMDQALTNVGSISMDMVVTVDNEGKIIGRYFNFLSGSEAISIGYSYINNKKDTGYQASLSINQVDLITCKGRSSKNSEGLSGVISLDINDSVESVNINASYDKLKVWKKKTTRMNGEFILATDNIPGYSVVASLNGEKDKQNIYFGIKKGSTDLLSVDTDFDMIDYVDFSIPSGNIYDAETQMDEYNKTANVDSFLQNIADVLGVDVDDLKTYYYNTPSSIEDKPSGSQGEKEPGQSNGSDEPSLPDGVKADESGYYSYEVDYDEIMKAGKASSGYAHFPVKASDIVKEVSKLAEKVIGKDTVMNEPLMYNIVSGYLDGDDSYEDSYYATTLTWNDNSFINNINLTYDTVSDEVIEVDMSNNHENIVDSTVSIIEILEGKALTAADKKEISKGLTVPEGEDYIFYLFGNYKLYLSIYDDYNYISITPEQ